MRRRAAVRGLALSLGFALAVAPAPAGGPVVRTETAADLERGRADGIALTGRGLLFAVSRPEPFGAPFPTPEPAQIWSMAAGADGSVFLGTSPDGRVLKIDPAGETTVLFTADEPMITALAVDRRGGLLAASAPGGAIYRIDGAGNGDLWSETDELYVWALAPAAGDKVYAGTGERGRILEIQPSGRADPFFDGDESHIVSLAVLPGGDLLAGGAGRGFVYRIDREGHAIVLHDDDLPEVAALAVDDSGIYAALIAPPEAERRRPALRIRLPDGVQVAESPGAVGVLEEEAGPTIHGLIEGLPVSAAPRERAVRGRVIRITRAGEVREIWRSYRQAPLCLRQDGAGRVLFGTGEPGSLYRVGPDGDPTRIASLLEAQVTALVVDSRGLLLATANPAQVYRIPRAPDAPGEFLSRPVDAGGLARWGSIAWSEDAHASTRFYTRTGNSSQPDETWSAWSPALSDANGSRIVNPDGRFLQWRLTQSARAEAAGPVSGVTLYYEPYNRAPVLDGFRAESTDGAVRGPLEFRWTASDPDGDPVRVVVEYRSTGAEDWSPAQETQTAGTGAEADAARGEGRLVWDTDAVEEGRYEVRATASDQAANPPGEGLTAREVPVLTAVVDRTPPRIDVRSAGGGAFVVGLEDRLSMLRPLEILHEGTVRFTGRPEDGVCDSPRERFRVGPPAGAGPGWTVRGSDAAGNSVERPIGEQGRTD